MIELAFGELTRRVAARVALVRPVLPIQIEVLRREQIGMLHGVNTCVVLYELVEADEAEPALDRDAVPRATTKRHA